MAIDAMSNSSDFLFCSMKCMLYRLYFVLHVPEMSNSTCKETIPVMDVPDGGMDCS